MSHADQHQLVHEVDHLGCRHEFLFEGFYSQGESCAVHQHGAFGWEVAHYLFDVSLEVALEQSIGFVHDKKLAVVEEVVEFFG